jgi:hypothetical protein
MGSGRGKGAEGFSGRHEAGQPTAGESGRAGRSGAVWGVAALWTGALGVVLLLTQGEKPGRPVPPDLLATGQDLAPTVAPPSGPIEEWRQLHALPRGLRLEYSYRRLLSLNDPAPGGGSHAGDFEISDLNDAGQAPLVNEDEGGEALFLIAPGGVRRIVKPGAPTPCGVRFGGPIWTPQAINSRGQVVWSGQVENGEGWTFLYDPKTACQTVVARPGLMAPGGAAFANGGRERPVINDAGEIAFVAYVPGERDGTPTPGVFALLGEDTREVAREGTPAPGGRHFLAAESPAINNAGTIVFHALVSGMGGLGVYRWEAGRFTPIAVPGTNLGAGQRLEQAYYPQIDASARVAFVGVTRGGVGLYLWAEGQITPVLMPGDLVQHLGPLQAVYLNRRQPYRLNAGGEIAFSGHAAGREGVFVWRRGQIRPAALAGMSLAGVGLPLEVGSVDWGTAGGYGPPGRAYGPGRTAGPPPEEGERAPQSPSSPPDAPEIAGGGSPAPPAYPYGPSYGYPMGGSFGLGFSNNGKLLFAARIGERTSLILATPRTARGEPDRPKQQARRTQAAPE